MFTDLVEIVTGALCTEVNDTQLQSAVTDFAGTKLVIAHIALLFSIDPEDLILPLSCNSRLVFDCCRRRQRQPEFFNNLA